MAFPNSIRLYDMGGKNKEFIIKKTRKLLGGRALDVINFFSNIQRPGSCLV